MSKELTTIGENDATAEKRKAFVDGCNVFKDIPEVTDTPN